MNDSTAPRRQVSWSEWRFVALGAAAILFVTTLPYIYAYLLAPPDKQFMGIMLDVPDHAQYFSWMRELSQAPLAANKLTPEPNEPIFFNLLWWGLGRTGRLLGLNYEWNFQLLRIVGGILFLFVIYRMIAWFMDDIFQRRVAFILIALSSGFGWILIVMKYTLLKGELLFPSLVYIAEGNSFLGILGYPHFIAAALYIFIFYLVLRGQMHGKLGYAVSAGLLALFLGWQHAYDLILVWGVLGAYTLTSWIRDREAPVYLIQSLIIIVIVSFIPALYSVLLTSMDPLWKEVLAQFVNADIYTPNPIGLVVLLGLTFLLAIYTSLRQNPLKLASWDNRKLFINTWFWTNFLLVYIPVNFQIHLINGWQVPIGILATQGAFDYVIPWLTSVFDRIHITPKKFDTRTIVACILILVVLPTNIYLWAWRFVDLARHDYPYYLSKEDLNALLWLENNIQAEDVVLSSITLGQYIPVMTGGHAFLAHWAQTLDYFEKERIVQTFFASTTSEAWRQEILHQYSVDYIYYGSVEQEIGSFVSEEKVDYLRPVLDGSEVTVYRVIVDNEG